LFEKVSKGRTPQERRGYFPSEKGSFRIRRKKRGAHTVPRHFAPLQGLSGEESAEIFRALMLEAFVIKKTLFSSEGRKPTRRRRLTLQ